MNNYTHPKKAILHVPSHVCLQFSSGDNRDGWFAVDLKKKKKGVII